MFLTCVWRSSRVFLYYTTAVKLQPLLPPTGQKKNCRWWQQAHRSSSTRTSVDFWFFLLISCVLNSEVIIFLKKGLYLHRSQHCSTSVMKLILSDEITSGREKWLWHICPSPFRFLHLIWKPRLEVDWKKGYATAKLAFRWCGNCMLPKQGQPRQCCCLYPCRRQSVLLMKILFTLHNNTCYLLLAY